MATTPRWKTAIQNALSAHPKSVGMPKNLKQVIHGTDVHGKQVIQLASIDPTSPKPHVRSHIFRSFLTPSNKTPESERLPLILSSTDIRTPKVEQIIANPNVEIAWWIEGTQEQFRISGIASVVSARDHLFYKHFEEAIKNAGLNSGLRNMVDTDFDWEEKRREVFESMSAHMKASWCRPTPGSVLTGGEEVAKRWPVRVDKPGDEDGGEPSEGNKRNWEVALGNFALVVVDPTEVDYVELGVIPNRRSQFWRNEGVWEEKSVVP
ncbi:hypothetical protein L218DRAFT_962191 [Marasmius fiardii PR-910]|nr:hypothetical protein L218DRAFT_962191 [Marasmius fiardii PR-910]